MLIVRDISKQDLPQLALLYEQFWGEESHPVLMASQLSIDAILCSYYNYHISTIKFS